MNKINDLRKNLERLPIQCPECGDVSDSIKSYSFVDFAFFFIAYKWGYDYHVACAKCMRRYILDQAVQGIGKAHLLWPIAYLPRLSVNFTRTFVKGHSEDVIDDLQLKYQQK